MDSSMEHTERTAGSSEETGFDIAELDAADRRLCALVHELNQSIADGCEGEELQRLTNQLLLEALSHFEHEERVLAQSAYPLPKGHAALHRQIRAELEHALAELGNAQSKATRVEYGLLVKQLFVEHMRQETMKYKTFLRPGSRSDSHRT
jgi:hemerythrin-like metal-binding protein